MHFVVLNVLKENGGYHKRWQPVNKTLIVIPTKKVISRLEIKKIYFLIFYFFLQSLYGAHDAFIVKPFTGLDKHVFRENFRGKLKILPSDLRVHLPLEV